MRGFTFHLRIAAALAGLVALMLPAAADAGEVTIRFSGRVTSTAVGGIAIGTPFHGEYTYDADTQPTDSNLNSAFYQINPPQLTLAVGDYGLPAASYMDVTVASDTGIGSGHGDAYLVRAAGEFGGPDLSVTDAFVVLALGHSDPSVLQGYGLNQPALLPPDVNSVWTLERSLTVARLTGSPGILFSGTIESMSLAVEDAILAIKARVDEIVAAGAALPADGRSLLAKLDAALACLEAGDAPGAIASLQDFINHVRALMKKGRIDTDSGGELISAAQSVIDELSP